MIENPILRGFFPDPSIVRVGDDYFIATSTFEWHPGVAIHHSKDLVHWRLVTYAVTWQMDLRGNPDSGGVWAPCLSHDGERFYLIFTDVKAWSPVGHFKDLHNYLITASDIMGPWSEPIYLNSSGFDPSLFHDDDGKKWLLNMLWDHRAGKNKFGGIVLQEYDPDQQKLVGKIRNIYQGTSLGFTEAPHIYKHNGWYHLMTAEGGTGYRHAVTMARARSLFGAYETDPHNPMLTSFERPELLIQKAGHASLVQTQRGQWYIAHLCGRPLEPLGRCNLGRETALQAVEWRDDWLRLVGGGNAPAAGLAAPNLPAHPWVAPPTRDDFDAPELALEWNSLRVPMHPDWLSLTARPGFLRLVGRESLSSKHHQSLVARRLQAQHATVQTCLEFVPQNFQQMAGLVLYYDTSNYFYLCITHDATLGRCLMLLCAEYNQHREPLGAPVPLSPDGAVHLQAVFSGQEVRFAHSSDGATWLALPAVLEAGNLSDEAGHPFAFTGTFVGMAAQDLSGNRLHADFDSFVYLEGA
jgi:xylan 1,4-beta-xylosidase